jgi:hypothetical protein
MFRRKRWGRWIVVVKDNQTDQHITTQVHYARTAQDAGDLVGHWLDLEGFDFEARLEVAQVEPND